MGVHVKSGPVSMQTLAATAGIKAVEPSKVKLIIKGRSAVEPESELQDTYVAVADDGGPFLFRHQIRFSTRRHHVLEEGDTIWNASMAMTDVRRGTNSYYKLQVWSDAISQRVF